MRFLFNNVMVRVELQWNLQVLLLYYVQFQWFCVLILFFIWTCKMVLFASYKVILWCFCYFHWCEQKMDWFDNWKIKLFVQISPFLSCSRVQHYYYNCCLLIIIIVNLIIILVIIIAWVVIVGCTRMISCDSTSRLCCSFPILYISSPKPKKKDPTKPK